MKRTVTFRMNFITLTLSSTQAHPDNYIKEHMLQPFLKWMARQGANTYAWKAETQNNGNIHFHITGNRYIYYKSIRDKWNSLQEKHGYISAFFKEHGHRDPNSTDVHAVRDDRQIGIYLCKEFGKTDSWSTIDKQKIPAALAVHPSRYIDQAIKNDKPIPLPKRLVDGRKWSISNNLVGLRCFIDQEIPGGFQESAEFLKRQDYRTIDMDFAKMWFYPFIGPSTAPNQVMQKLMKMKKAVESYDD